MKMRNIITLITLCCFALFWIFSFIEYESSILIVLFIFSLLVSIKIFEVFMFYYLRAKRKKIGELELFTGKFRDYLISIVAVSLLYLSLKYSYLIDFAPTKFLNYFFDISRNPLPYFIISLTYLTGMFLTNNHVFYITESGLIIFGNYFESYFWNDFIEFSIIEEQSLIRFKKKNNKFLFVKFEESYFEENKEEILKVLNKNILYV